MNFPIEPTEHSKAEFQEVHEQSASGAKVPSRRRAWSVLLIATVIAITLTAPGGQQVFAKGGRQAAANQNPDIDSSAMDALEKMGAYLRTIQSFQVTADMTTDEVLDDGQTIQSSREVNLLAVHPDRFRAEITADDEHRFYFYDGKNFSIFGQLVNYYATVPAPPTTAQLLKAANDKYGIELPLVDLFQWGTKDATINRIKAAEDIGPATIDGVTCEQYAFHQDDINWQIWIQLGKFPLPRKLVIQTLTDDARPQHSEKLTWNLAPSFSDDAFTFNAPADAKRITIAEVKGATGGKP